VTHWISRSKLWASASRRAAGEPPGHSGRARQYTGTAGRIENAQVAVYLTYISRHGHAAIDRALPAQFLDERPGTVPAGHRARPDRLATKPQLTQLKFPR
jgi:SRSO17 transposase